MRHLVVPISLSNSAAKLDALLPQYQCGQCDYVDCAHYAQALAQGKASPTQCAPGRRTVAEKLAQVAHVSLPEDVVFAEIAQQCVMIDEANCIGCTRCLRACPLDALIGARRRMHSVLSSLCSGCGLCVPTCPVDCMTLIATERVWTQQDADAARARYHVRLRRLMKQAMTQVSSVAADEKQHRQQVAQDALAQARARRLQWAQRSEGKDE